MPEDTSNPFAAVIGALTKKGGDKGVIKDKEGKVSPHLTPSEAARYEKIFGIMKSVVNPGPETGQLDSSTTSNKDKASTTSAMQKIADKTKGPGMEALAAIGGAAALIGAAFTTMSDDFMAKIDEFTGGVVEFADSTGDELGKLGGLALKVGAKIGLKGLKMIPFLGAFVNFYYAFDHFQKGEYFDGVYELISGVAQFFPGPGTLISMVMDGYKIYAEIEANKVEQETGEKPTFSDILGGHAKKLFFFVVDKITKGQVPMLSTIYKFGEGIYHFGSGRLSEGLESWSHILPSLLGGKESPIYKYVAGGLNTLWELTKESAPGAMEKAGEMASDAWGWMKDIFSDIGEVFMGFFDGIKNWIGDMNQSGKEIIYDLIPDVFKDQGLNEIKANPKEYTKKDLKESRNRMYEIRDRVGVEEFEKNMMGTSHEHRQAWLKEQGYVKAVDVQTKIANQKNVKDGQIYKNGTTVAYDSQDDVLAAKRGGPIDKMLDGNSAVMKSIQSINSQQLNVLVEIREGIKSLKSSGGDLAFSNTSLTQEFFE